jgi:hypothetical protein
MTDIRRDILQYRFKREFPRKHMMMYACIKYGRKNNERSTYLLDYDKRYIGLAPGPDNNSAVLYGEGRIDVYTIGKISAEKIDDKKQHIEEQYKQAIYSINDYSRWCYELNDEANTIAIQLTKQYHNFMFNITPTEMQLQSLALLTVTHKATTDDLCYCCMFKKKHTAIENLKTNYQQDKLELDISQLDYDVPTENVDIDIYPLKNIIKELKQKGLELKHEYNELQHAVKRYKQMLATKTDLSLMFRFDYNENHTYEFIFYNRINDIRCCGNNLYIVYSYYGCSIYAITKSGIFFYTAYGRMNVPIINKNIQRDETRCFDYVRYLFDDIPLPEYNEAGFDVYSTVTSKYLYMDNAIHTVILPSTTNVGYDLHIFITTISDYPQIYEHYTYNVGNVDKDACKCFATDTELMLILYNTCMMINVKRKKELHLEMDVIERVNISIHANLIAYTCEPATGALRIVDSTTMTLIYEVKNESDHHDYYMRFIKSSKEFIGIATGPYEINIYTPTFNLLRRIVCHSLMSNLFITSNGKIYNLSTNTSLDVINLRHDRS